MGKSSSPPAAPDPYATAAAQGAANVDTARVMGRMNNPNIINPYGQQNVTWAQNSEPTTSFDQAGYDRAMSDWQSGQSGGNTVGSNYTDENWRLNTPAQAGPQPTRDQFTTTTPGSVSDQPTVTQSLSPVQQGLFDTQNRISQSLGDIGEAGLGRVGQAMSSPLSVQSADELQNKAEAAYMARINPIWDRRQEQEQVQLANQGLRPGMEAYSNAMDDFNRGRNDATQQGVIAAMGQRPQTIQEELAIRNQPLTEVNALRTGSQPSIPQFQQYQGSNMSPAPIAQSVQNAYAQNLNAYNANQASQGSFMSGLMGLGGAALMSPQGSFTGLFG